MTSPARPATEGIPLLDLRAQYESIRGEIREAVDEVLRSQQFILGPQGEALEKEIAQLCGVRDAVGAASGTDALELALYACGVGNGDEVWFNSGDGNYYVTAGNLPAAPALGVVASGANTPPNTLTQLVPTLYAQPPVGTAGAGPISHLCADPGDHCRSLVRPSCQLGPDSYGCRQEGNSCH